MTIKQLFAAVIAFGLVIGVAVGITTNMVSQPPQQVSTDAPKAGALSGPDISSNYLRWGAGTGVQIYPSRFALRAASTTPCDITSPAATSSLARAWLQVTTATSSAGTFTVATSTISNATTTPNTSFTIAANTQGLFVYLPSTMASTTFAPNTHLTFGVAGVPYGYTYGGTCGATFNVL